MTDGNLHLYALVERPLPELPPRGAFGEELVQVDAGEVVAVAGSGATPAADADTALAHARLVEALAADAPALLPSRFGEGFADVEALREALAADARALGGALARVRGCVEVGLHAVFAEPEDVEPPRSGREYILRRAAAARLLERLERDVHTRLERLARDARLEERLSPLRFSASYLVERECLASFLDLADRAEAKGVQLVRTGPWAPYSFVAGGDA